MDIVKGQFDRDVKYKSSKYPKTLENRDPFLEITILSGKTKEKEIPLLSLKNSPSKFDSMALADKIILAMKKLVPLEYFGKIHREKNIIELSSDDDDDKKSLEEASFRVLTPKKKKTKKQEKKIFERKSSCKACSSHKKEDQDKENAPTKKIKPKGQAESKKSTRKASRPRTIKTRKRG